MEMLRDIPGYKAALKAVLKAQIQFLAEQLSSETDEEMVILSASTVDGSLCQLGSQYGKNFLHNKDDIQSQFSQHCLQKKFETPTGKEIPGLIESEEVPDNAVIEPTAHPHIDESLTQDEIEAELSEIFGAKEGQDDGSVPVTAKPGTSKAHGREKRKKKAHESSTKKAKTSFDLNEKSEREEIDQNDTVDHQAETSVDNAMGDTNFDKNGDSKHEEMPFTITKINTADRTDDENKVKVEPESDNGSDIDSTGDRSDGENTETIDENEALTSKGDKPPKLEVAEPVTGQKETEVRQCHICMKHFTTNFNLKRHSRIHLDTPQFHCRICNQYFSSSGDLEKHKLKRHSAPVLCSICGRTFTTNSDARRHALLKHDTLPDKSKLKLLTCPYKECSKRYNQITKFNHHLNTHTGNKPYSCAYCGKKYSDKYCKKEHEENCGGEVSLICPHCGLAYSSKRILERHIDSKHLLKTYPCWCGKVFTFQTTLCKHKKQKNH